MKQILSIVAALSLVLTLFGTISLDEAKAQGGNLYQPGIFYQPRATLGGPPAETTDVGQDLSQVLDDSADPVIIHEPPMVSEKAVAYIVLEAEVTDDTGVDMVTLTFTTNRESGRHTLYMDKVGANMYKIALPHRREGTFFRYYFTATDLAGNTVSTKEYTLEKRYDRYDDEQRRTENRSQVTRVTAGGSAWDTRSTRSRITGRGILNIPQPRELNINRPYVPTPPAPTKQKTYTVKGGDSLGKIAMEKLSTSDWRPLWEANKDQISDPNVIRPGMILRLP